MKTRTVCAALVLAGCGALFWCCDLSGQRQPVEPVAWTPPKPPATATAPATISAEVVLTKPPVLGPAAPAIFVLPDRIDEPLIRVKLTEQQDTPPSIPAGKYRGRIDNHRLPNGKYVAINVLPLDLYLQGVLAKELYGSWEPATFRAQAIAARTFAIFQMCDSREKQWDVNDDESSQVYGGIAGETPKARAAVAATRGQVMLARYNGQEGVFCARFSACIGGAAQDPFDAWGDPSFGPLVGRMTGNVDNNSDRFIWKTDFVVTRAEVSRCIQSWGVRNNFAHLKALGTVLTIVINKRNPATGRPTELLLTDAAGKKAPIRAEEFRLALMSDPQGKAPKPYSSNFDIRAEGQSFVLFNGRGYGHGIGLSQWGAQNLAKQGQSHTQILAFFYPGASLKELW